MDNMGYINSWVMRRRPMGCFLLWMMVVRGFELDDQHQFVYTRELSSIDSDDSDESGYSLFDTGEYGYYSPTYSEEGDLLR
jgi:hypothetical protein